MDSGTMATPTVPAHFNCFQIQLLDLTELEGHFKDKHETFKNRAQILGFVPDLHGHENHAID